MDTWLTLLPSLIPESRRELFVWVVIVVALLAPRLLTFLRFFAAKRETEDQRFDRRVSEMMDRYEKEILHLKVERDHVADTNRQLRESMQLLQDKIERLEEELEEWRGKEETKG